MAVEERNGRVICQQDGAVMEWIIDNPPANALDHAMMRTLEHACDNVNGDASVRAVLLTGAGSQCFSAGGDLGELLRLDERQAMDRAHTFYRLLDKLPNLIVPVICASNGSTVGGGLEIAVMCDFIFAAANAKFGLPEIKSGVAPTPPAVKRLAETIGYHQTRNLLFTGELISAEEAHAMGLLHAVVHPDDLHSVAREFAHQMACQSRTAFRLCKKTMLRFSDSSAELSKLGLEMFRELIRSADMREGIAAFLEKRAPDFSQGSAIPGASNHSKCKRR